MLVEVYAKYIKDFLKTTRQMNLFPLPYTKGQFLIELQRYFQKTKSFQNVSPLEIFIKDHLTYIKGIRFNLNKK